MKRDESIVALSKRLRDSPTRKNWDEVERALRSSGAKYYEVVYSKGGIKRPDDLRRSSIKVYDSRSKEIAEFPMFIREKGRFEGSLYVFRSLVQKRR